MALETTIALIGANVWRPYTERVLARYPSDVRVTTRAVLSQMHNRHVGVTPGLAAELAPLLTGRAASGRAGGAWGAVFRRLDRELTEDSDERAASPGLIWSAVPLYFLQRLALPVIAEACHRIGTCLLFCEDRLEEAPDQKAYRDYAQRLYDAVVRLAGSDRAVTANFWRERALALAELARYASARSRSAACLPETRPDAFALLNRLRPEVPAQGKKPRHPKPLTNPKKHKETRKLREGGIEGIKITRRPEDVDLILYSEFLNHPVALAERLLNTGYLAYRRQPKREKTRDALLAAIMPNAVKPELSADFVKAAWFNLTLRLSRILTRFHLSKSEFRWIEGNALGNFRQRHFHLQDLSLTQTSTGDKIEPAYLRHYLMGLGWLPHYLDRRASYQPLSEHALERAGLERDGPVAPSEKWAFAAWSDQRDSLHWSLADRAAASADNTLKLGAFRYVHIMLFLPVAERAAFEERHGLSSLFHGFGLGRTQGRSVSVTWVPASVGASDWAFEAGNKGAAPIFSDPETNGSPDRVSGQLVGAWLERIIEEIWRV